MELTDTEVLVLYKWILRNGWIDRDWEHANEIREVVDKIKNRYMDLEFHGSTIQRST